jgi:hypothetical protein
MQMHRNTLKQNGLARVLVDSTSVLDPPLSNHLRSSAIIWIRTEADYFARSPRQNISGGCGGRRLRVGFFQSVNPF